MTWPTQKTAMTMEKIPDVRGMLTSGSVTACATAAHADTEGTAKAQCSAEASSMQLHFQILVVILW